MPDYIPTKVLLHDDPEVVQNPKSLYPLTGINAIVAGTSGDNTSTYITNSDNKIKYKYLEIVDSAGKIYTGYLPIDFVESSGKIANSDLDIFNTEVVSSGGSSSTKLIIKPELLPGFVDDVISIPVITGDDYPSTGDVVIKQTGTGGNATYTFMKRVSDNGWSPGGGKQGVIYISDASTSTVGAGSMFRCVSENDYQAVCISTNPYAVDETATNGVGLELDGATLKAAAVSATTTRLGTIQVDTTTSNGVSLGISGGIVSAAGTLAGNDNVGVVYAVGDSTTANQRMEQFGVTYVVPTAKFMYDYISATVVGVAVATSSATGVVQIGSNIDVTTAGIISVKDASANHAGVVYLEGTIATSAAGNTDINDHAVTVSGVTTYVADVLAGYQKFLSAGSGLNISRAAGDVTYDYLTLNTSGAVVISGSYLTARNATNALPGVVVYTGDSSLIESGTTATETTAYPIVVNPKAVKDYVAAAISASASIPIPTSAVRGGFRTSSSDTGLTLGTAGGIADILKINTADPAYIDPTSNKLSISSATLAKSGVVNVVSTSAQVANADYASYVPNNAAVKAYVTSEIASAGVQGSLNPSDGIFIGDVTEGATVISNVISAKVADPIKFDDNGSMTISRGATLYVSSHALHVSSATYSSSVDNPAKLGAVYLANDATATYGSNDPYAATPKYVADKIAAMGVDGSAVYTPTSADVSSGGSAIPLGGVRVVSDGGIKVNSGNIYLQQATNAILGGVRVPTDSGLAIDATTGSLTLQSATSTHLGGIKLAATSTGLTMGAGGVLSANIAEPLYHSGNAIAIRTADVGSAGVVSVATSAAGISAAASAGTTNIVPNAAGLSAYVSANNEKLAGSGLIWSGGSLHVQVAEPIQINDDKVGIRTATAQTGASLTSAALGAVYVRGAVRSASVIEADDQGITLNTVPTESAVRSLTDLTSTTIMNTIDARLYITYTPIN